MYNMNLSKVKSICLLFSKLILRPEFNFPKTKTILDRFHSFKSKWFDIECSLDQTVTSHSRLCKNYFDCEFRSNSSCVRPFGLEFINFIICKKIINSLNLISFYLSLYKFILIYITKFNNE